MQHLFCVDLFDVLFYFFIVTKVTCTKLVGVCLLFILYSKMNCIEHIKIQLEKEFEFDGEPEPFKVFQIDMGH